MFHFTKKSIIGFVVAATAVLAIAASSASAGGYFPSINGGNGSKTVMVNTVTVDGLALSLIVNANVKEGEYAPFWARIWRKSGDSTKFIVAGLARSTDHTTRRWWAEYTVDDENVIYSVVPNKKTATPPTAPNQTGSTGPTGPTGATGPKGRNSSGGSNAASNQLIEVKTNLQFVDPDQLIIRIGKLKKGEFVTISGRVFVPKREKTGNSWPMFFRLMLGATQLNPDDTGFPQEAWGRSTASLYIAN